MRFIRWLTAAFIVFLFAIVLIADLGSGAVLMDIIERVPGGDKTGHLLLMGTLSLLVNLSLRAARVRVGKWHVLKGSLLVTGVVVVEECSQVLLAARGFSLLDLAADIVGIVLFGEIAAWLVARRDPAAGRGT